MSPLFVLYQFRKRLTRCFYHVKVKTQYRNKNLRFRRQELVLDGDKT